MKNHRGQECASNPSFDRPAERSGSRSPVLSLSGRKRTLSNIPKQFYYPGLIAVLGLQRAAILCQLIFLVETQTKFVVSKDEKKWARIASWKIALFFPGVPERNIRLFIHDLEAKGAISTARSMNGYRPDKARWITINDGWLTKHGNINYNPFDAIKEHGEDAAIAAASESEGCGNNCRKKAKMRQLLPSNKGITLGDRPTDTSYQSGRRSARHDSGSPRSPHHIGEDRGAAGAHANRRAGMKASEISVSAVDAERLVKTARKLQVRTTLPLFIQTWREMFSVATGQTPFAFTKKEGALAKQLIKWLTANDVKALSFIQYVMENWNLLRSKIRWPDSKKSRITSEFPNFEEAYWIREDIVRMMTGQSGPMSSPKQPQGAEVYTRAEDVPANHPHRKFLLSQIAKHGKGVVA